MTPLIVFLLIAELYLRQIDTSYSEKVKGLKQNSENIEVLFLGNSHTAYGIDPKQFHLAAYNMAQVSQSLYFDKRITLKYLSQLPKLKYVVIGIDYHSLYFSSQSKTRDIWSYYGHGIEYKEAIPYLSKLSRLHGYSNKIAINFFKKDVSRKYDKVGALDVENGVELNQPIQNGTYFFEGTDENGMEESHIIKRTAYFNDLVKQSEEKNQITSDLEDFIHQLHLRKITPIFITTPCYSKYVNKLDKKQFHKNESDIRDLSEKLNVVYWNYIDLPMDKNSFYNCDHLNKQGAMIFSKILNEQFKKHFNVELK